MDKINYENELKQQYLLQVNNLKNVKNILEFQINELENKLSEMEKEQQSRLYVKNKTNSPIFVEKYVIKDFVKKDSLLKEVSNEKIEHLYLMGYIEDIGVEEYLEQKKEKYFNNNIAKKKNKPSSISSVGGKVFMRDAYGKPCDDDSSNEDFGAVKVDIDPNEKSYESFLKKIDEYNFDHICEEDIKNLNTLIEGIKKQYEKSDEKAVKKSNKKAVKKSVKRAKKRPVKKAAKKSARG